MIREQELRQRRVSLVRLKEYADIVDGLCLDKACADGIQACLEDYFSMFMAGYCYEFRVRIYNRPREDMKAFGLAHARGRLAALYDLKNLGVAA